jgi:glycosyltransferase involved in cell wall biosynthesis
MVVVSHPTGNQNVRQVLHALEEASLLDRFHTTVYWDAAWKINNLLPGVIRAELNRRTYPQTPRNRIRVTPVREAARLISQKLGVATPNAASVLTVAHELDRITARTVSRLHPQAVYAYEGVALRTFEEAKKHGITCIYELPSGYWYYEIDLLREEAALRPDYADTIAKLKDSAAHQQWKDRELQLADHIIVPSRHVQRTLARLNLDQSKLSVVPYGANESKAPIRQLGQSRNQKLRVLYVGALTQRKGIGYLIDAVNSLSTSIEFTMIGGKVGNAAPIETATSQYRWLPSAPHSEVLAEMARHDVLVLPSLSEGFALVIGEALSRGLPVITTLNSGGEEIVRDGQDGFFVPIRSSQSIAEKLQLLNQDPSLLDHLSSSAVQRAKELNWTTYRARISQIIRDIVNP